MAKYQTTLQTQLQTRFPNATVTIALNEVTMEVSNADIFSVLLVTTTMPMED